MHIGHARTYTVPDVYARYRRLQGDNVLFPIAWHVTGTPIIGAVNRLQKGEEEQLSVLRDTYNVPEDELETLETPMGFARYFIENHYKENMQSLGLSIDWRREFTTNDERYSKFVTWQYETLRDHGRLEKGLHPVKYCTDEENPVTTHDILEGEEAEFQEYTLVKFGHGDTVVPMATLRPETVRGVTNAYIDPDADYVEAEVDGERWLVSDEAAEKLVLQQRDVRILDRFTGDRLVGERVTNPVTGEDVLVLPADFVDADNATGVVMSVPAHSRTTGSRWKKPKPTTIGCGSTASTPPTSTPSSRRPSSTLRPTTTSSRRGPPSRNTASSPATTPPWRMPPSRCTTASSTAGR